MKLLDQVNLFKINSVEKTIELESLLGQEKDKISLEKNEVDDSAVAGDIVLLISNNKDENLEKRKLISYPVRKIKGRFSDVKEYQYLKMKVLYDFNLHYLDKKDSGESFLRSVKKR